MPSMVFISHSSKDRATADAICAHLESAGIAPRSQGHTYLLFAICYLSFGLKGRSLSLARLAVLRLNAVCAIHFQIVPETDAGSFNPVAGQHRLANRVRSQQEEYG
jgi:hypothetical protein